MVRIPLSDLNSFRPARCTFRTIAITLSFSRPFLFRICSIPCASRGPFLLRLCSVVFTLRGPFLFKLCFVVPLGLNLIRRLEF